MLNESLHSEIGRRIFASLKKVQYVNTICDETVYTLSTKNRHSGKVGRRISTSLKENGNICKFNVKYSESRKLCRLKLGALYLQTGTI